MDEKMKEAVLAVCEKYAKENININVDFAYELIQVAIQTSETKIDDMLLPAILATKTAVKNCLNNLADKIDGDK